MMGSIKKNFIYNVAYQILIMFIPLITTPYVSRVLGSTGIGKYSYANSIAAYYVMFIMLGLNNYGNRTIAKVKNDKEKLRTSFWSIYLLQFFLGLFINLIYLIYCIFISENPKISLAVGFYVFSACFDINWLFFGLEKFKISVIRNAIIKVLSTIAIFLFVKKSNDTIIYCLIITCSLLISQLVLWPYIFKQIKFYKPKLREITVHIKPNLFLFLTVIAVSLFKVFDKIMLGMMTTKTQVGFYESSEKVINIPTALITSLGTVMLPRMTNMVANNDKRSEKTIYYSILFAMFISSSLCFGIMAISKQFVPLFYGKGFEVCITLFIVLLPTCLFLAFANVIRTQYLLPHQMDKSYVISAFLGAAINIMINLLLIKNYGAVGVAVGTLFAEATVCIYQCYQVRKFLPIYIYIKKSIPLIVSGLIMFICLFNFEIEAISTIQLLILKIVLGVILYFSTLGIYIFLYKLFKKKHYFDLKSLKI